MDIFAPSYCFLLLDINMDVFIIVDILYSLVFLIVHDSEDNHTDESEQIFCSSGSTVATLM